MVVRPDQTWVSDMTAVGSLREFVYLVVITDVFTCSLDGGHLGRSLGQELTLTSRGLGTEPLPKTHQSDQRVRHAAIVYFKEE